MCHYKILFVFLLTALPKVFGSCEEPYDDAHGDFFDGDEYCKNTRKVFDNLLRYTEEEQKTVDFFMKVFGADLKDFLVVVFTYKDRLEDDNITIDDFVQTMDNSSNLRKLIDKTNGRYTAIGYKGREEDRVKEVKHILSMIDGIKGKDGRNYYSNDVFKEVQELLEENERKRKEEENMYTECKDNQYFHSPRTYTRKNIANNNIPKALMKKVGSAVYDGIVAVGGFVVRGIAAVASCVGGWFGF